MANMYAMQKRKLQNSLEAKISDKDLFGPAFEEYAQSLVEVLAGKYTLHVFYDPNDSSIGWTDGRNIHVNAGCKTLSFYAKQEMRFNSVLGVVFHECGHCNDPTLLKSYQSTLEKIENSIPFIDERDDFDPVEQEVYDALSNKDAVPIIFAICKDVMNIGLDAHDEAMMTLNFNSLIGYCLTIALGIQEAGTPRLDQLRDEKLEEFDIVMSLLFQFIRYGKYIMKDTDESWDDPAVKKVIFMSQDMEIMRTSDDPVERENAAFNILVNLWPLVKDKLNKANNQQQPPPSGQNGQNSQSGQSGQSGQPGQSGQSNQSNQNGQSGQSSQSSQSSQNGQSGQSGQSNQSNQNGQSGQSSQSSQSSQNGQSGQSGQSSQSSQSGQSTQGGSPFTQQGVSSVVSAVQKASSGLTSQTPQNAPGGKTKLSANPSGKSANGQNASSGQPQAQGSSTIGKDDAANALAQIKKAVAAEKADEKLEKDQTKATSDALQIVQTENACTTHRGRPIYVRTPSLSTANKAAYERIYREVAPFVQRLVAEMKALFEELREGSIDRGRTCGRVDMKSLRRIGTDAKIFSNKKNPIDIPDMVLCLLLDQSGSMSGRRIHACEKAAVLLEAFARMLDIPVMVCGHNTGGGGINFYVHRDFDSIDARRKYSLADIDTDHSNRDGYAIYAASELLGKRAETDKVLLIISDGQPADSGYGGDAAAEDIRRIVKNANRKYGIETIAAAIGDDKDRIKKIYGNGYLDISDLSKLPKALTKIIRDRLEA